MTIVIAAGGTGGHLYPGVALAREFLRRDPRAVVRFVGTSRGIEAKVLSHEGLPLDLIDARPVMGLGLRQAGAALLALPKGLAQSWRLLRAVRADLVIGIGGYTSPPVLLAAALLRIPRVILEPNAYPGMANKLLGPLAQRVFLAFETAAGHFAPSKVRAVGTPIRRAFLDAVAEPHAEDPARRRLLVFGGSRGAHAINLAMLDAVRVMSQEQAAMRRLRITHQTGEADHEPIKAAYDASGVDATVVPFLFDMPTALRAADLVVARSGAMTLAELTACGKPSILVPLPHAIYQHQARNAEVLERAGAAVVIPQSELTGARLARVIAALIDEPGRLAMMGERSRSLAKVDAAEAIVEECLTMLREGRG
ncbi:undecaprenyldiphospho-muramoylpentapeptide beta-N-acetylglucosaminyltransferase [Candidatus Nitrospira bockiana]